MPVADPTPLFASVDYRSTGALLWPDYWQSSAAPDLAAILNVPELPRGTFESGQMVFDKARYSAQPGMTCRLCTVVLSVEGHCQFMLASSCTQTSHLSWGRLWPLYAHVSMGPLFSLFSHPDIQGSSFSQSLATN